MKNGSLPNPTPVDRHRTVLLCGDISLHRRLFSDSVSRAAGLNLIRCAEDQETTFSLIHRLNVSILVVRQAFLEQFPDTAVLQFTNFGKGSYVLAVLESDTVDVTSTAKMLRLGCRGVLPRRFSSKLFRKAILAVLKGELWAPRGLIAELLSDLLRAASLKAENGLTPQEARILELSSQGYKNSAIADALFISLETVRWHKRRINRKLHGPSQPRYPQTRDVPSLHEKAAG